MLDRRRDDCYRFHNPECDCVSDIDVYLTLGQKAGREECLWGTRRGCLYHPIIVGGVIRVRQEHERLYQAFWPNGEGRGPVRTSLDCMGGSTEIQDVLSCSDVISISSRKNEESSSLRRFAKNRFPPRCAAHDGNAAERNARTRGIGCPGGLYHRSARVTLKFDD